MMWWLLACAPIEGTPYAWDLPRELPRPVVPDDNPMTEEKVELGRFLFHDTALSRNRTQACSTCHLQARGFADGEAVSEGSTGASTPRGSMGLVGVGYATTLTWANPRLRTLEEQALVPLFGEEPVELGWVDRGALLGRLAQEPGYPERFAAAWPSADDPFTLEHVVQALASYQRSLISADSPYDRLVFEGDWDALDAEQTRGMELFFSETLECFHCHGGPMFSDSSTHESSGFAEVAFHNNGLHDTYDAPNVGLLDFTGVSSDEGRFKAPTLKNIAVTAPYMHDGSLETLEDVVDHYARGGVAHPNQSRFVGGFEISESDKAALVRFLESLTDERVLQDPRHGDPFTE